MSNSSINYSGTSALHFYTFQYMCMPRPLTYISHMQNVAPGPPQNLEVLTIFQNFLGLRWDPPSHPNGILTHYRVGISEFLAYPMSKCVILVHVYLCKQSLNCQVNAYAAYVCLHLFISFLLFISLPSKSFLAPLSILLFFPPFLPPLPSILPPTINRCAIYLSVQVHKTGLYQYRTTLEVLPTYWTN